jgi:Pyruvate/2-oxoacid:ferredoxin oxidoreductase delta subunit
MQSSEIKGYGRITKNGVIHFINDINETFCGIDSPVDDDMYDVEYPTVISSSKVTCKRCLKYLDKLD